MAQSFFEQSRMQLLNSSPIAVPQFFSLSILLPNDEAVIRLADPLLVPGPTATLSRHAAVAAIAELHETIVSEEDSKVKICTTTRNGLTIYYRVLNSAQTIKLLPLVLTTTTTPNPVMEQALLVVSVGISGTGCLYGVSQTIYDVKQRIHDAVQFLLHDTTADATIDRVAEFLLSDTELLISNEQMASTHTLMWDAVVARNTMLSPIADGFGFGRRGSVMGGNQAADPFVRLELPMTSTALSSQRMLDKLTIMSVSESDTRLHRYSNAAAERRPQLSRAVTARRRKHPPHDDLDGSFDFKGKTVQKTAVTTPQQQPPKRQQKLVLASSKKDTARAVRSSRNADDTSTVKSSSSQPSSALLVNLALNEDLTCAYRNTQLSSCVVEGVVQAQLRCSSRTTDLPFELSLHDPKGHLETVAENRKFAKPTNPHTFSVVLPKTDTYFPILKYKCTQELRPVPIRVQTKIKSEHGACRVALQISSNPHNNATLSDLTIMMGVPEHVNGETLQTQPPGGVWDQSKSSVLWCVSELGSGEKFQLQARFSTNATAAALHFPVLVRCQCLQTQLSEMVLLARDRPDVFPAELTTNVARRYRVSHREKNDSS